jgi:hypothetical protein
VCLLQGLTPVVAVQAYDRVRNVAYASICLLAMSRSAIWLTNPTHLLSRVSTHDSLARMLIGLSTHAHEHRTHACMHLSGHV